MSCSLRRWFVGVVLALGATFPSICLAQAKVSFSDFDAWAPETSTSQPAARSAARSASRYYYAQSTPSSSDVSAVQLSDCEDTCSELACCGTSNCYVPRNWATADYLMWWTRGNHVPALVSNGVPFTAGYATLYGDRDIDDELRSGLRVSVGHWADPDGTIGIQADYLGVLDDSNTGDFAAATGTPGTGLPVLARPYFDAGLLPAQFNALIVSAPGIADGAIAISSSSEMHSASLLLRKHYRSGDLGRIDLVGGYRYFRLRDGMLIQNTSTIIGAGGFFPVGTVAGFQDSFLTENEFHGGDVGFVAEFWRGNLSLELQARVATGNLHRTATISGGNIIDPPPAGGGIVTPGGLLAQPTNIGNYASNDIAIMPEVGVNLNYQMSRNLSFHVGYTILGMNGLTRTGDVIDTVVNGTQINGGPLVGFNRPGTDFDKSNFWAQGINFGLTVEL